jgi:hypothetical protein
MDKGRKGYKVREETVRERDTEEGIGNEKGEDRR